MIRAQSRPKFIQRFYISSHCGGRSCHLVFVIGGYTVCVSLWHAKQLSKYQNIAWTWIVLEGAPFYSFFSMAFLGFCKQITQTVTGKKKGDETSCAHSAHGMTELRQMVQVPAPLEDGASFKHSWWDSECNWKQEQPEYDFKLRFALAIFK